LKKVLHKGSLFIYNHNNYSKAGVIAIEPLVFFLLHFFRCSRPSRFLLAKLLPFLLPAYCFPSRLRSSRREAVNFPTPSVFPSGEASSGFVLPFPAPFFPKGSSKLPYPFRLRRKKDGKKRSFAGKTEERREEKKLRSNQLCWNKKAEVK
jgi:hypothetical protein